MTPTIRPLGDSDESDVVAYVTTAQDDPARHVTFVGVGAASVRNDLTAIDDWRDQTFVATGPDGHVVGVLLVDTDDELGRCWWLGPWADDEATARALLDAAAPLVADLHRREFAPDARNTVQADLATDLGYGPREASAILALDLTTWEDPPDAVTVLPLDTEDRDDVAALHDRLFPGTHTPGRRLVRDDGTSVLVVGEPPVGYVATQVQGDGSVYVDFLGVDPGARGRGYGRALVAAALRRAAADGVDRAYLTVRVGNAGARALYASLGFDEERIAQPFTQEPRRG